MNLVSRGFQKLNRDFKSNCYIFALMYDSEIMKRFCLESVT